MQVVPGTTGAAAGLRAGLPSLHAESPEHKALEEWARMYGGTAILGFISTLLLGGKFIHHVFQRRGLVCGWFIIPPAMLSGLLGLLWFTGMEMTDPLMTTDLRFGLEALKGNLINFVFAALILGITCGRANSQHTTTWRGIFTSLFHEGMPMIIYSQILIWGQTTCCLLLQCAANTFFSYEIPNVFSLMIPLAVEAGGDLVVSQQLYKTAMGATIVEEAESLGLMAVCVMGVFLFTLKPAFISKGWLGDAYARELQLTGGTSLYQGTGQAEAFQRGSKSAHSQGSTGLVNRAAVGVGGDDGSHAGTNDGASGVAAGGDPVDTVLHSPNSSGFFMAMEETPESAFRMDKEDINKHGQASLGAHIALIALTAFLSFGLALTLHMVEIELRIDYHWISGVRMFKLAMCTAMISMQMILQRSRVKFNRDWFMRLCGLMLDLLVISALAKAYPKPHVLGSTTRYTTCGVFIVVCLLWNMFCFVFVARRLFPNYWYERAVTLLGDSMGHSYTGLLFIRTLDPDMESPVPAAYAYKLMLFFIPSSGAKQTIINTAIDRHGAWAAFGLGAAVVAAWLVIFDTYFRHRFVSTLKGYFIPTTSGPEDLMPLNHSSSGAPHDTDEDPLLMVSTDDDRDFDIKKRTPRATNDYDEEDVSVIDRQNDAEASVANSSTAAAVSAPQQRRSSLVVKDSDGGGSSDNLVAENINSTKSTNKTRGKSINSSLSKKFSRFTTSSLLPVKASEPSSIISAEQMSIIASFLSDSKASNFWRLSYSLRQHGASLSTLLSRNLQSGHSNSSSSIMRRMSFTPCVILIEDSWGYIFGGFVSPALQDKASYYGNGECFVFSLVPVPHAYKWTGKNNFFVVSNDNCFAMGGGGDGFALQLDDELDTGVSNHSDTYNNPILSSSEFFKCLNVELWMLEGVGFSV